MYLDKQLQFSDAQALTATAASTNIVDLGHANRDPGNGYPQYIVVTVDVALAGTTPTLKVGIQMDDNEAFASATTMQESQTYSALAAGAQIIVPVPHGITERYMRLYYTMSGTSPTATVTAGIVVDPQAWRAHPAA